MPPLTRRELLDRLGRFPRKRWTHLPTPLRPLEALSARMAGPRVFMKRDDLTGIGFGGNKSRKWEFIIGDVLAKKADTVITWASLQSNWCLQTAAACARFGIKPVLILFRTHDADDEPDGNLLLDHLLGAEVRIREAERGKVVSIEAALEALRSAAGEYEARGRRPYIAPVGGSMTGGSMSVPLGAMAYVDALAEIAGQADHLGISLDTILHATGSGGTQAGLIVGVKALGLGTRVIGISVSEDKESFSKDVFTICRETEDTLGLGSLTREDDVLVIDEYIRDGYGIVDRDVAQCVARVFREEGVLLDPVYTGKAALAMEDMSAKGRFGRDENLVFLHTGGTPALFPYRRELLDNL